MLREKPAIDKTADEARAVPDSATLYEDMRFVRHNPKTLDVTEGQKDCRRWKENDLKGFLSKFADLEKARGKEEPAKEEVLADAGSDRVESLGRELIDRAKEKTLEGRLEAAILACKLMRPFLDAAEGYTVEQAEAARLVQIAETP
jgi:hypothetical protein